MHKLIRIAFFSLLYWGTAKLGYKLAPDYLHVASVWFPAGISIWVLLTFGVQYWPSAFFGALLFTQSVNVPLLPSLISAIGDMLTPLIAALALKRARFDSRFETMRDAVIFAVLGAIFPTLIGALFGTFSLYIGDLTPLREIAKPFRMWWLADTAGIMTLTPFLLSLRSHFFPRSWARRAEVLVFFAACASMFSAVFIFTKNSVFDDPLPLYASVPLVVWSALRFGIPVTTATTMLAGAAAIWNGLDHMPSMGFMRDNQVLHLQLFMGSISAVGLLLSSAVQEQKRITERLELALTSANMGTWNWDISKNVVIWSDNVESIFGLERGEFKKTLEAFLSLVYPEDLATVTDRIENALAGSNNFYEVMHRILRKDGQIRWIGGKGQIYRDHKGRPIRMTGTVTDITERRANEAEIKHSEARKASILESALDCIISMNHRGEIVEFNPAAEKTFGYKRADVIGKEMAALIIPERFRNMHREGLHHYVLTGESRILGERMELPAIRSDGTEFPSEVSITRIRVPGPPMFTGFIRDISERKRMESERERMLIRERRSRIDAEKSIEARDDFLSIASHELRTPLTPLSMYMQIIKRQLGDPETARNPRIIPLLKGVDNAAQEIRRLTRLIDDLLDVTRITAGRLTLAREDVDLNELVHRLVERFRDEAENSRCKIMIEESAQIHGEWDRARLEQVITNLFTNALKYGAGKPIVIQIGEKSGNALFMIHDQGIGISQEDHSKIFERFERAAPVKHYGGLGLGLYISKQIVSAHLGKIWVESEPGKGSTFAVELPEKAA